ncbi:thermonuclease family protein [Candidatus Nitrosotenuis cloacae]|uniref:thermonuclease family protein n=1 Tax=Candidatus Nitrosotenuis cloacae TaxID=1603555 RepID=UPI00227E1BFE|nr:thermonuclease family protein [Candidatus Nitrosotenuis cloacae]
MKEYIFLLSIIALVGSVLILSEQDSFGHSDGCHRWHSCPSDSGSYTCGDTGHCSQCPDNNYCKAGQPRSSYESKPAYSVPTKSYEPAKKITPAEKPKTVEKPKVGNTNKANACSGTGLCITDRVMKIVDGDTIYIKNYKIRLSLTNTPEKSQAGFNEAKSFTTKLCPIRSTITVDQDDKQPYDAYKRLVGKVTCSGKVLNSELLENGHASILTQYCKKSEFASESWAKKFGC